MKKVKRKNVDNNKLFQCPKRKVIESKKSKLVSSKNNKREMCNWFQFNIKLIYCNVPSHPAFHI